MKVNNLNVANQSGKKRDDNLTRPEPASVRIIQSSTFVPALDFVPLRTTAGDRNYGIQIPKGVIVITLRPPLAKTNTQAPIMGQGCN